MFRRTFAIALMVLIALGLGLSALAFQPPGPPQSDPPPQQLVTPAEPNEKSATPIPKIAAVTPLAPAPKDLGTRRTILPGVINQNNWSDKQVNGLLLVASVESGSAEGAEVVAAMDELAEKFVGRISFQIEIVSDKTPTVFLVKQESGSAPRKKFTVVLRQHCLKTHLRVMNEQLASSKPLAWTSQEYFDRINKDDGQKVLSVDDLTVSQVKLLSAESQKRWLNGQLDAESLALWLEVVGKQELKIELKPGPPCFRVMTNETFLLAFSTRSPQPVLFVHMGGREPGEFGKELEEPARRAACFPNVQPWVVDSDSDFGKGLHRQLSEDKAKGVTGVAPYADVTSLIVFQMGDDTLNPLTAKKLHWGPYKLDPKKSQADELERVLDELKLPRCTNTLVVTQTTSADPGPRLKK